MIFSIWVVGTAAAVLWPVATIGVPVVGVRAYRLFTGQVTL